MRWFLLFVALANCENIRVYESISLLNDANVLSGLKLKTDKTNLDIKTFSGITMCAAFKFKRLLLTKSKLMTIQSQDWRVFNFMVGYEFSFLNVGNFDAFGSSPGWIMQIQPGGSFFVWSANVWHQICVSYDNVSSYIRFVMVNIHYKRIILDNLNEKVSEKNIH